MNVSEKDFEFMVENQTTNIVALLVDEQHLTMREALDIWFKSETYKHLNNPATGLYFQSPRYVYSYLCDEAKK
jgi:hypothetical protein